MSNSRSDRRDFVLGLTRTAAGAWLAAHAAELRSVAAYAASVAPQQAWEVFTPDEARELDAVSAQIVPTDDTPGAREAHVVRFLDRYFATVFKAGQPAVRNDLKVLGDAVAARTPGNRSLASLTEADQLAFLREFEKSRPATFGHFRALTMLGMFSDPRHGGNLNKVGWRLIGFEDRYSWAPPFGYYDRV